MNHYSRRPTWDDYYMRIAWDVSLRGNCIRQAVGALIVGEWGIMSTGYTGTPFGVKNCNQGGCPRCQPDAAHRQGYDTCLCLHAEQNAIILAARQGTSIGGTRLYVTLHPCLDCLKMILQAGICEIIYHLPVEFDDQLQKAYQALLTESDILIRKYPPSPTPLKMLRTRRPGPDLLPSSAEE